MFQDEDVPGKTHQSPTRPGSLQDGLELSKPVLATTAIPLGFTTTRRPRVKSNIAQANRNRPSPPPSLPPGQDTRGGGFNVPPLLEGNTLVPAGQEEPVLDPFDNPPFLSVDGKKPRVKADINSKQVGHKKKAGGGGGKHKKQGSKRVELDRSQFHNINFISPTAGPLTEPDYEDPISPPVFSGPEVRPDGRVPRVKADVLAAARDQGGQSGLEVSTPLTPRARNTRPPRPLRPTRPPPSQLFGNSVNTQSVAPSTVRNSFPPELSVSTPQPIFTSTFRPFAAEPPQLSILSSTASPRPTQPPPPPPTFRLPPPPSARPGGSRNNNFGLGPPPQPSLPANLPPPPRPSFNARPPPPRPRPSPPPPQPSPPPPPAAQSAAPPREPSPLLQRDRNRFGSRPGPRPRVKANELAQKANGGSRVRPFNSGERESPRNRFASQNAIVGQQQQQQQQEGQQRRPSAADEILPGVRVTEKPRSQSRPKFRVRFKTVNDITDPDPCKNPFKCPPRQVADGRKPRVKSNIKAARRNFWNPRKTRVKKKRKQGKLNAALWNRGIIRRGRKQNLSDDKSSQTALAIDNEIEDRPITTEDPIRSLKQIVASKEKQNSQTFSAFPAARSFQNKRLRSKQKINQRSKKTFRRTTTVRTSSAQNTQAVVSTTPISTAATTNKVSLFVTPPPSPRQFLPTTPTVRPQPGGGGGGGGGGPSPLSVLPDSKPTQSAPESPFTVSDIGLFVTNPRALPEHQLDSSRADQRRNLFQNPPRNSPDGRRKPRVKSNIMAGLQQSGQQGDRAGAGAVTEALSLLTTTERTKPVLRIVPDGRSPRVKSDLLNKTNRKNLKNKKHNKFRNSRRGFGRSLDLDSDNEIDDTESFDEDEEDNIENDIDDDDDYIEPEVRPDGRKPRIKSDLLAKKKSFPNERSNQAQKKKAGGAGGRRGGGFRHSKKVSQADRPERPERPPATTTTPAVALNSPDNAVSITTFRPPISLDGLMKSNETLPPPPPPPAPPVTELSVPLPNFDKSIISTGRQSDRQSGRQGLFEPRPFSDLTNSSPTEIVRVSSADQNLFNSDYYDYYQEFFNT